MNRPMNTPTFDALPELADLSDPVLRRALQAP